MKKRFLLILLAIVSALCLVFGLTACGKSKDNDGPDTPEHTHTWATEWSSSSEGHFHYATCEGHETVKDKVIPHTFENGECTICHYPDPAADVEPAQCTVTYNANGGEFAEGQSTFTQTVKSGAKLTAPQSPARSNYTFAGWAKSQGGSEMWKFDEDAVTTNVTLWAKWTQKSAVILSVDGASIEGTEIFLWVDKDTSSVPLTGKVVCSEDSSWRLYADPDGMQEIATRMANNLDSGENMFYIVVSSTDAVHVNTYTLTIYRSFAVNIDFYFKNEIIETKTAYTGVEFNVTYIPTLTGYTFNHWKDSKGNKTETFTPWGNVKLYADATVKTYTASLNVGSGNTLGEGKDRQTMTFNEKYSFPVPTRTGYSFTGWYWDNMQVTDEKGKGLEAWTFDGDRTIDAHWQANNYTVTVKQNDSEGGSVSGEGEHAYDSKVTLTATTNNGYNFLGWYDKNDELVSDKAQYTFKMGFDVSYTAKWEIAHYTLTFVYDSNVGDAEEIIPTSYTIKDLPLTLPTLIGKNGNKHISIGWKAEDGTEYTNEIPAGTTGELTLTVVWGVTEGTHSYGENHACTICGKQLYLKSEDGKIYFGEYPQTEVTDKNDVDKSLRNSLGMVAGSNPTSSNAGKWNSYDYYISSNVSDYMWYIDIPYQGNRYRGVYFTSYRPAYTTHISSADDCYQDDNGYKTSTVYWFKWEPIEWRILEEKDGKALLMANIILDSQQYYHTSSNTTRMINGRTVYENNYKESDIRAWLNDTFYETAFDEYAKAIIEMMTVDNSASSTASNSNSYACENTQDKVFLLSFKEVLNTSYGFSSSSSTYDTARQLKCTDYAKSQGVDVSTDSSYRGIGWWWLRSPHYNSGKYAYEVNFPGSTGGFNDVCDTFGGVVPALWIRL